MTNSNPDGFRHFWYMTAGLYAFATITVLLVYTPPLRLTQIQLSFKEKLSRLDWVGYVLLGLGLVLWVLGLEWAENPCECSVCFVVTVDIDRIQTPGEMARSLHQ